MNSYLLKYGDCMRKFFSFLLIFCVIPFYTKFLIAQEKLSGFVKSFYFNEQVCQFNYDPEIRVFINAPSFENFNPQKPTCITLYALPNGNSIEWTTGKQLNIGDDWHYDIQHIGAQTRFLRENDPTYNYVTVYLETKQLSWPSWKSKYPNTHATIITGLVEYIKNIFSQYNPFIVLNGHSGGGRFTFSFLDGVSAIPSYVKRITFLDSDYGYDNSYGPKFVNWLNSSPDNYLCVIAYNDSVALYNGQPIVSATGGTWYRSQMMKNYLIPFFSFTSSIDENFMLFTALSGRIKFILKQNPTQAILHTVQVEKNGFIHGMLTGTDKEEVGYIYYGNRAYTNYIQSATVYPNPLSIPPRQTTFLTGSQFMQEVTNLTFQQREDRILQELTKGNIPDFMRELVTIMGNFQDVNGITHSLSYYVMPDYLAIGSNQDFCRIPTGPITAQRIADLYGATMPTRKLVDNIYSKSTVKLEPVTYAPVGNNNELVPKFIEHNNAIENQRIAAGGQLGDLTGGTKKDVVISNLIVDPNRPNHVVIYGWHKLDGTPIQPLTNIHINSYVDYSHGIRYLNNYAMLDGKLVKLTDLLIDEVKYKIISDESSAMYQPTYLSSTEIPSKPNSFGVINNSYNSLKILIKPNPIVTNYEIYLSTDGTSFNQIFTFTSGDEYILSDLEPNKVYFIKIKAVNDFGKSQFSEVLAAITSAIDAKALIVNGFDRATAGNTYNFIIQHGQSYFENGIYFCSASNEAVIDGIINLNDYEIVSYILGEESTADETFNSQEQTIVANYLKSGGKLFVSGSEIAWDLDNKGTTADKNFIHNYLKTSYKADAPFGVSGTYYNVTSLLNNNLTFAFDNGTHGLYNTLWPDVIGTYQGSYGFAKYNQLDTSNGFAGIFYSGIFNGGTLPGKVIVLGFPFETVVTNQSRNQLLNNVFILMDINTAINNGENNTNYLTFSLSQNYPNPFNPSTTITFTLPNSEFVSLRIYNILGQEISTLVNEELPAGSYSKIWDAKNLSSGIYLCSITTNSNSKTIKMNLIR